MDNQPVEQGISPVQPQSSEQTLKPLRTYQGDVNEAIQRKTVTITKMALAENARNGQANTLKNTEPAVTSKVLTTLLAVLLLLIGSGGLYYVYVLYGTAKTPTAAVTQTDIPTPLIPPTQQRELPVSSTLASDIYTATTASNLQVGQLQYLYIRNIDSATFLAQIKAAPPTSFVRSLTPEFMVGIDVVTTPTPFIILKNNFYQNAFAGMLRWEDSMYSNLKTIFPSEFDTSTTTAITNTAQLYAPTTHAEDATIRNKDVRIIRDIHGNELLLYSFIDKDTIVITKNETVFRDLLDRIEHQVYSR